MNSTADFFLNPKNYLHKDFGVRIRTNIIFSYFKRVSGKHVLDLGCGDGRISLQFMRDNYVTLVDPSIAMLELARTNAAIDKSDQVRFVNSSLDEFSSEQQYDIVMGIGVLAHVPDWRVGISKFATFTSTGGIVAFQLSDYSRWLTKIQLKANRTGSRKLNQITLAELIRICDDNGLSPIKIVRYGLTLPGMGILPNGLLYSLTSYSMSNKFLSRFFSEVIIFLEKKV